MGKGCNYWGRAIYDDMQEKKNYNVRQEEKKTEPPEDR